MFYTYNTSTEEAALPQQRLYTSTEGEALPQRGNSHLVSNTESAVLHERGRTSEGPVLDPRGLYTSTNAFDSPFLLKAKI